MIPNNDFGYWYTDSDNDDVYAGVGARGRVGGGD